LVPTAVGRRDWLLAMLLLVLGGCQRLRVPSDELVVLIEQPPKNIDPRYQTTSYDLKLGFLCYARLVAVDNDRLEPQLELAEKVTVLPSDAAHPSALRFEVRLRPARFADGSEVTADDVAYTVERLADDKTGSAAMRRRFSESGLIVPPLVVDSRTVRFTLSHPHASYLTDLDFGIFRRGTAEPTTKRPSEGGMPIGAGPFVLASDIGEVTRFLRNPNFYGGTPPIKRLTVRVIRDSNSRLLSLVGGSADLTQNTVSPLLFDAIGKWHKRLQLQTAPSALLFYLGMNNEDVHLRDPRVRRALALSIDRERIVRTKLHGKATLASGLLAPLHWAYRAPDEPLHFDPVEARRLLDEAGFPDPDGPGPKPRFTLQYKTSTDGLPVAIGRVIAAQLAEVGIAVELRSLEFHLFLSDVKKGNFQLYTLSSSEIAEPNVYRNFFHSAFIPTAANLDAGLNRMRYRSPEIDGLLDEGQREMDREKRKLIYARVQAVLARDLPMLPLWHPDNVFVARRIVHGFRMWPSAQLSGLAGVSKLPEK
jgi:peptide/nickel transport system substrate-binding protein